MTRIEAIDVAVNVLNGAEVEGAADAVEKLTAMKEQIAKKRTTDKPTKKQKESAELKAKIAEVLAGAGTPLTASNVAAVLGIDYRQVAGLVRNMDNVSKEYDDKGKAVYTLVTE